MKKLLFTMLMAVSSFYANATFQTIYGNEVVMSNTSYDDLYISAGTVRIEAPVHGDVVICGGTVIISDSVTGSIFVLGGELTINSYVGGHLRCAGGKVAISSTINRDLIVGAGDISSSPKTVINGGVLAAGGKMNLSGVVNNNIQSYAGNTSIDATVKGDINCRGEYVYINGTIEGRSILAATDLQIGSNAAFQNQVRYWDADSKVDFKGSLFDRSAILDQSLRIETDKWQYLGFATVFYLAWYLLAALLVIFLIQYLFRNIFKRSADRNNSLSARSLGYGVLFMIILPAAAIISIITLIGIPVGVVLTILLILLGVFNSILLSVFTANWINNRYDYNWGNGRLIAMAFVLFIGIKILTLIPFIGWIGLFLLTAIMFGSIIRNTAWKNKSQILAPNV